MSDPIILPLKKVPNARDLGSYVGVDGRRIKTHKLLRSGKIFNIPQSDQNFLKQYNLSTVIDLRTTMESDIKPDTVIDGVKNLSIPIHKNRVVGVPTTISKLQNTYDHDQYAGFKTMCHQYRKSVNSEISKHAFNQVLETMANLDDGAVIFHCSEGKDRTGLATIYILHILGVNMQTIRADYLLSNYMLRDYQNMLDQIIVSRGGNNIRRANFRSLSGVANEYFDTAMLLIDNEYGGLDQYLADEIGVTDELIEQLRNLYLESKKDNND